jgi:hypothetical protein
LLKNYRMTQYLKELIAKRAELVSLISRLDSLIVAELDGVTQVTGTESGSIPAETHKPEPSVQEESRNGTSAKFEPHPGYPSRGTWRQKILFVLNEKPGSKLNTKDIMTRLKALEGPYGSNVMPTAINTILQEMERKHKEISVERLENGRKLHMAGGPAASGNADATPAITPAAMPVTTNPEAPIESAPSAGSTEVGAGTASAE